MALKELKQDNNEKIEDFIERAILEIKNEGPIYELVFNDGVKLTSREFDKVEENLFDKIHARYIAEKNVTGTKEEKEYNFDYDQEKSISEEIEQYLSELETHIVSLNTERIEELENKLKKLEQEKETIRANKISECDKDYQDTYKKNDLKKNLSNSIIEKHQRKIQVLSELIKEDEQDVKNQQENLEKEEKILKEAEEKLEELLKSEHSNQQEINLIKKEIEYRKWSVEAYTEYIEYMKEEMEPIQDLIQHYQQQIELQEQEKKNYIRTNLEEVSRKYGTTLEEVQQKLKKKEKIDLPIENMPEVKTINTQISKIKQELELEKNQKKCKVIRNMINSNAPYSQIEEQLYILTKNIETKEIEDKFNLKERKTSALDKKIEEAKEKQQNLLQQLDNETEFLKKEEFEEDNKLKEMLKKDTEKALEEQQQLEEQLNNHALLAKIPTLKSTLKNMNNAVGDMERAIVLGAIPEAEIETQKEIINKTKQQIKNLETQINQIKENKPKQSINKLNAKLGIIRERIMQNNFDLKHLEEKSQEDYIDTIKLEKTKKELKEVETNLQSFEQTKKSSDKITIEDIKEVALEEISKFLKTKEVKKEEEQKEETVENYEDAPKTLIQKIKDKEFIKKAKKALASIAILVTMSAATLTTSSHEVVNNNDDVITVDDENMEEENYEEVASYEDIGLEEPSITIEEQIKEAQQEALEKIQEKGSDAIVYASVFDAANEENGLKVNNNITSWENAEVGALYAVKDNEHIKINISQAEKYMEDGYEITTTYLNEDQTIGSTKLEMTGKSK